MKVYELKALLSRLDPNAEVFITTADQKGHGCFVNPVAGAFQDRTVRVGSEEASVLVLNGAPAKRVWAAKAHGTPAPREIKMRASFMGSDVSPVCVLSGVMVTLDGDRIDFLLTLWHNNKIELFSGATPPGWEVLTFQDEDEARLWADKVGINIVELYRD